jgi:hypothetical protein
VFEVSVRLRPTSSAPLAEDGALLSVGERLRGSLALRLDLLTQGGFGSEVPLPLKLLSRGTE